MLRSVYEGAERTDSVIKWILVCLIPSGLMNRDTWMWYLVVKLSNGYMSLMLTFIFVLLFNGKKQHIYCEKKKKKIPHSHEGISLTIPLCVSSPLFIFEILMLTFKKFLHSYLLVCVLYDVYWDIKQE